MARAVRIMSRLLTSSRAPSAASVDACQLVGIGDLPQKPRSDLPEILRHPLRFLDLCEQGRRSSSDVMGRLLEALRELQRERRLHRDNPVHLQPCDPLDGCL
jgi:hypothetical protein